MLKFAFARSHPAVRGGNNDEWDVVSPYGDATVSVHDNGGLVLTQVVPAATPMTLPAEVGEPNVATITSDLPILVHHHADDAGNDNDAFVLSPPAREIFGGSTGNTYLAALQDGTVADVYTSSGTHQRYTLSSTTAQALQSELGDLLVKRQTQHATRNTNQEIKP